MDALQQEIDSIQERGQGFNIHRQRFWSPNSQRAFLRRNNKRRVIWGISSSGPQ